MSLQCDWICDKCGKVIEDTKYAEIRLNLGYSFSACLEKNNKTKKKMDEHSKSWNLTLCENCAPAILDDVYQVFDKLKTDTP